MVRENKILHGQEKVRELYSESGETDTCTLKISQEKLRF